MDDIEMENAPQGFQPPFDRGQLQADVGTVLLTCARAARWVFQRSDSDINEPLLRLLGYPLAGEQPNLNYPEIDWQSGGFQYDMVATTAMAESMETLYDLAYLGHVDADVSDLNSESMASWISRVVMDLRRSEFVTEWNEYSKCEDSIQRCLQVFETAQARLVLEGIEVDDRFMDWHGPDTEGLSIRQMSLLSGMTEASLRTLASPKRKNPLKTQSDGKNTFVTVEDAKAWLVARGRYVPIKHTSRGGRLDLKRRRFGSIDELLSALDQRVQFLLAEPQADEVRTMLAAISPTMLVAGGRPHLRLDEASTENTELMAKIGEALGLSGTLLGLRAAETRSLEQLRAVERQIQSLTI